MNIAKVVLAGVLMLATLPSGVEAQYSDELRARARRESSERFNFEFRVGTYRPDARAVGGGNAFAQFFGSDRGPLLQLELDAWVIRIPYVGLVGAGLSWGWARYKRGLCDPLLGCTGNRLDEKANARLWPVAAVAVLRVDALARELGVPIIVTGKLGLDVVFYNLDGGASNASGQSLGLRWAVQFALELDFINPARARSLDEEWGINHTTLFVELFGSTADSNLDVGTNLAWAAGLGLVF